MESFVSHAGGDFYVFKSSSASAAELFYLDKTQILETIQDKKELKEVHYKKLLKSKKDMKKMPNELADSSGRQQPLSCLGKTFLLYPN